MARPDEPLCGLLERAQAFQERLMDVVSLDELVSLACSVLDASLYICDHSGFILASSPCDERTCPSFRSSVQSRSVGKEHIKSMLSPKPLCNVIRDAECAGEPCTRLSFPLQIGQETLPGVLTFFFWSRALGQEDQALASMVAGAFSVWMRRRYNDTASAQMRKISLLRALLDYKPGLRSYYLSNLTLENMHDGDTLYRLICCLPDKHSEPQVLDSLCARVQRLLPDAWTFSHKDCVLTLLMDDGRPPREQAAPLCELLREAGLTACVSTELRELLDLRYACEATLTACRIAMRKTPGERLYLARDYLSLTFLHRCQQYFPIQDYYLDGFRRLAEYDRANNRTYLTTLSAYLDNGLNINAAARQIFMHRNTMTQQIERIEQILGFSLQDHELCWYLQLCLRIHELQTL